MHEERESKENTYLIFLNESTQKNLFKVNKKLQSISKTKCIFLIIDHDVNDRIINNQ